jgi:uncharacterized protein YceK
MPRNLLYSYCLLGLCCCASGCVSLFANGIMMERMDPPGLYAGVRASTQEITKGISQSSSPKIIAGDLLMILDLPLEAAMDTLLVPWVIAGTIEHNQRLKQFNDGAKSDADDNAPDGPSLTIDHDEARGEHEYNAK